MDGDVVSGPSGRVLRSSTAPSSIPAATPVAGPAPPSRPPQQAEAYILRCPNEILTAILKVWEGFKGQKEMLKAVRQTCAQLEPVASAIVFKKIWSNRLSEGWIDNILELADSPLQTHVRSIKLSIVNNCGTNAKDWDGCSLRDYWLDVHTAQGAIRRLDMAINKCDNVHMDQETVWYYEAEGYRQEREADRWADRFDDEDDDDDGSDDDGSDDHFGSYGRGRSSHHLEHISVPAGVARYKVQKRAAKVNIRKAETKLHKALWPTIAIHIAKALPSFTSLNKLEVRSALPVELTPSMAQAMARSSSIRDVRLAFSSYNRKTLDHLLKSKTHKSITLEVYDCDKFLEVIGTKSKWIRKPDEEPKKSFTEWCCVVGKE